MIKDSVPLDNGYTIPYTVHYSVFFDLSVSAEDHSTQGNRVYINGIEANTYDELANKVLIDFIPREMKKYRKDKGFWEYLGIVLFNNEEKKVLVIHSSFEKNGTEKEFIYQEKIDTTTGSSIDFNIATLGLLW